MSEGRKKGIKFALNVAGKEMMIMAVRGKEKKYTREWLRMRLMSKLVSNTHSGNSNTQTIAKPKQKHVLTMEDKI